MTKTHPAVQRRVNKMQAAFDAWTGDDNRGEESALQDFLTDLRHWAEAHEQDFYGALDKAYYHYYAERGEGDDIEQAYREDAYPEQQKSV